MRGLQAWGLRPSTAYGVRNGGFRLPHAPHRASAAKGKGLVCQTDGQMVVEMAVLAPVMMVVALVVLNLAWFLEACARFDRMAPDVIMAVAVSPAGELGGGHHVHEVAEALGSAMEGLRGCSVDVNAESAWDAVAQTGSFSMAPHLTRYVCTLRYAPWPSSFSVAGIDAGIPFELCHKRSFVVDLYRCGVVF